MTRDEMIERLGLSKPEFEQFIQKFKQFYEHLTPKQQNVVKRAVPKLERAARLFGRDATVGDLHKLLDPEVGVGTMDGESGVDQILNPTTPGDDHDDDDIL